MRAHQQPSIEREVRNGVYASVVIWAFSRLEGLTYWTYLPALPNDARRITAYMPPTTGTVTCRSKCCSPGAEAWETAEGVQISPAEFAARFGGRFSDRRIA